jgi:glycosyltransferase involved in cell wall biosynthesis
MRKDVRVVVPAFRAECTIRRCIDAIVRASVGMNIEIVVIDDGENPNLSDILADVPVKIRQTGRSGSAAFARNYGAKDFKAGAIVFVDADVVIAPTTLRMMVSPLEERRAHAVVGNYSRDVRGLNFASKYKQLYISRVYDRRSGYLKNDFWTAIGAIDAKVFHAAGGFDASFAGACGEDGEFGVLLTRAGHKILGLPYAVGQHLHRLSMKGLVLNDWRKGNIALRNHANSRGPLSDNKHATPRDVASVALAITTVCSLAFLPTNLAAVIPISLAAYYVARADVMARFWTQGLWFSVRAFWVMLFLDLVRSACVAASHLAARDRTAIAKEAHHV